MKKSLCALIVAAASVLALNASAQNSAHSEARALGKLNLNLGGSLVDSNAEDFETGLYSIRSNGTLVPLALSQEAWATGGGVMKDGIYYCNSLEEIWTGVYYVTGFAFDGKTWEKLEAYNLGTDLSFVATDMTYDATTGKIYGCFHDGTLEGFEFGTMEYGTEASIRETIAPLAVGYKAIAAAADGTLYAVDYNGMLVKVNKATGEGTVIGNTGLAGKHDASATIDQKTGEMYMTTHNDQDGGSLYRIDTATAGATLVCTFGNGEKIAGLFSLDASVMEAPDTASGIAADFKANALTGTVSFTAPTTTAGGDALTGTLSYTITANGETVATGTTTSGANVNASVTLPASGNYEIAVAMSNSAGQGKAAGTTAYVGDDKPAMVKNVTLAYANGKMNLAWDAPAGVNGGYIDQTKVTYNITRIAGNEKTTVATGIAATVFTDNFPEPEAMVSVSYLVTAVYMGETSSPAASNTVVAGSAIIPPYTVDFEGNDPLAMFTVIDANNDGKTWFVAGTEGRYLARVVYNERLPMDDWLITAPIKMEAGKSYEISFKTNGNSPSYTEHVEAFIAASADIAALSAGFAVAEKTEVAKEPVTFTRTFIPAASGKYYLGIHGCSDADKLYLDIDDISIAEGAAANSPAAPAIAVTPDERGDLKATVTVTAPSANVAGGAIKEITKIVISRDGAAIGEIAPAEPGKTYTYTDNGIAAAGRHTYSAAAHNANGEGKAATASAFVGAYPAPWNENFESPECLEEFTLVDANDDGKTWEVTDTEGEQGKAAIIAYSDNSSLPMDDWLISAPVRMEKGNIYTISFKAACYSPYMPERIEAFVAPEATAAGMAAGTRIIAPTTIDSKEYITVSETFSPTETGRYYIGIHGISDADMFYLYVDDINVSEGVSADTPDGATVEVTPDNTGAMKAVLSITAPTKSQKGEDLMSLSDRNLSPTKIEIVRDGEVVGTISRVIPGGTYTFNDDNVAKHGMNTWAITVHNGYGGGKTVYSSAYVGIDVPDAVTGIKLEEVKEGQVKISWTAPTVDVNGKTMSSSLTYKIIDANYLTVADNLAATEYVCNAVEKGTQNFVYYYIIASNENGAGKANLSDMILAGTPYPYPYEESFADGEAQSIFGIETPADSYAQWQTYTDSDIPDADGSNGFIGMAGYKVGDQSSLQTGKISLAGADEPVLSFYYNGLMEDNANTIEVAIREAGTTEWKPLRNIVQEGATEQFDWIKTSIPLNEYKGKTIQLQFTPKVVNYLYGLIDAIRISEPVRHDLAAHSITAPARIKAGQELSINVTVMNNGSETADGYTVELYRDGEKVQEATGAAVESGARTSIAFSETLGVIAKEASYSATVIYANDEISSNNTTKTVSVTVNMPAYPAARNLTGTPTAAGVQLTWDAPDLANLPKASVTEDFENAEPFAQNVSGWQFVDGDNAYIGGISGAALPFNKVSWFVLDYSGQSFNNTFASYSGTRHLAALFNYEGEQNDDWAISPALSGDAQTISLWARSYVDDYGLESMEILYSTTDANPSSFVSLKEVDVPAEWTELAFDLPEGARHFAVRYTSTNVYMLFVDDITYIPENAKPQQYDLIGYNIYRDGAKINDTPVSATTLVDTTADTGSHTYLATVVYAQGESKPSNEATVITTGISDINADNSAPNGSIYNLAGQKVDANYKGIIIKNGKKIAVR